MLDWRSNMLPIRWDPKSIPNSHVQDSTCWHTWDTLYSLLSSLFILIFIYKQHYVYLFFFAWYTQWPIALWIHSLSFYRGSTRMTTSWGLIVFKTRMLTSCRVYNNLLMGDWPILCGRERAFQGPPRMKQRIAARQSFMAKKSFWGPWSATCSRVGLVTLKTPRASPWGERANAEPMGSPVWLSAEATSAGQCWAWWL